MKNTSTVSCCQNLLQKPHSRKKDEGDLIKYTASINNTLYNMSVEYYKDTKTVKEFSLGFTLKEFIINSDNEKRQPKTPFYNSPVSSFSVFYNFINFSKYDLTSLEDVKSKKINMYKNLKTVFYGNSNVSTTKVYLRVGKVAPIYMLMINIYSQIEENENMLAILKNNKKQFPYDENLKTAIALQIEQKKKLKSEFINFVKNMLKRYF